jgi:hypothetical protein
MCDISDSQRNDDTKETANKTKKKHFYEYVSIAQKLIYNG